MDRTRGRFLKGCTMSVVSLIQPTSPKRPLGAGHDPVAHAQLPFEQAAAMVLGDLQHALADLLNAAPSEIRKIADVERVFGINHLLGWQVYRIVHAENPLAAGMHVPANVSLRKLLAAASGRGVPASILDRVAGAFEAFEHLVKSDAGDREEMEAMISALLPEERRKQELVSRQTVFKGMSQVKGLAAEAVVTAIFIKPSADDPQLIDQVFINGLFGLRRMRPDAKIIDWNVDSSDSSALTLDGSPITGHLATLLKEFSTSPPPRFESRQTENATYYRVAGNDVGLRAAIDLVMAERRVNTRPSANRFRGGAHAIDIPAKRAVLDVFAHKDVFSGIAPQLAVYDTAVRGMIGRFDDPAREDDRLLSYDEIRVLPNAHTGARLTQIPRYMQIVEHIYAKTGWDAADFRGYRVDSPYPVYGAQYMIGFDVGKDTP